MAEDDDIYSRGLTRADVQQLKDMLLKAEEGSLHFTAKQIETLTTMAEVWDDHADDFMAILKREQTSRMWAEVRSRFWSVAKWFVGVLVGFLALLQSVQALFNIDFTKWWTK